MHAIIAVALILFFGWPFLWTLPRTGSGSYPLLYSQFLLGIALVLLVWVLAQEVRSELRARAEGNLGERPFHPIEVGGYLLTCAYVWSWNVFGHVGATALFLVAVLLLAGERRPVVVVAFAVALPLVIQLFFVWFLRIPLPAARWNFLAF